MCIGIPLRVVETGDLIARCIGRNGEESVNMMLIGAQPVGTWVLGHLGSAREVLSDEDAAVINKALDGIEAIMRGNADIDMDEYFPAPKNLPRTQ
jgi:hydrogenase expression/formation protein HypC